MLGKNTRKWIKRTLKVVALGFGILALLFLGYYVGFNDGYNLALGLCAAYVKSLGFMI